MRLESKKKITIRGIEIGGQHPLVCLPLVAADKAELLEQGTYIASLQPDLIEWRSDSFNNIDNTQYVIDSLRELRKAIGNIPVIFTCRCVWEGGAKEIPQSIRKDINIEVLKTGLVDIVDIEISNEIELINEIKTAVQQYGGKLILSCHNFENTPDEQLLINKLKEANNLGADIAKLCVMPKNYNDVLMLLSATLKARVEFVDIPLITIAMGEMGAITRIAGGIFGSDVTFAIGKEISGPGQIPVEDLKKAWEILSL